MNKKDKKRNQQGKDKPLTVSLKDFQSEGNIFDVYYAKVTILSHFIFKL